MAIQVRSSWFNSDTHNGSVTCAINGDSVSFTYNLMDRSGEHALPKEPNEKLSPIWKHLMIAKDLARKEAEADKAYADKRSRGRVGGPFEFAFLIILSKNGYSQHDDFHPESSRIHGGGSLSAEDLREIEELKIPLIDTRSMTKEGIGQSNQFPMPPHHPGGHDQAPWGPLSYAPVDVIASLYEAIGAVVKNIETRPIKKEELQKGLIREWLAMRGWFTNRSDLLAIAMSAPAGLIDQEIR